MDPTEVLTGLNSSISQLNSALATQGAGSFVEIYSGDPKKFKEWIRSIDKYALMNNLDEDRRIKITFQTSRGPVSDFIYRWQLDTVAENKTYTNLRAILSRNFAEISDTDHAHALLRQVKQHRQESVALYAEIIYNLARDAYQQEHLTSDEAKQIVQIQLVNYFIDGLAEDSMRMKLLRDQPSSLDAALKRAMDEQNLRRRFEIRTNKTFRAERVAPHTQREETPMGTDHVRPKHCTVCNRKGHTAVTCFRKQTNAVDKGHMYQRDRPLHHNNDRSGTKRLCYFCQSDSHLIGNCEAYKKHRRQEN